MKIVYKLVMLAFFLSACGTNPATPISSFQLPTSTPRQTIKPTKTKTPAPTKPVTLNACVTNSTIRIRRGPGTEYEVIGGIVSGTCITIVGRNQDSSWVYIITDDNINGWVAAFLLTIDGNLDRVLIQKDFSTTQNVSPTAWINPFAKTSTPRPAIIQPTAQIGNCSPAYPSVCIPPKQPDLDCKDIPYRRFTVLSPDPHGFDGDGDGIGCE